MTYQSEYMLPILLMFFLTMGLIINAKKVAAWHRRGRLLAFVRSIETSWWIGCDWEDWGGDSVTIYNTTQTTYFGHENSLAFVIEVSDPLLRINMVEEYHIDLIPNLVEAKRIMSL